MLTHLYSPTGSRMVRRLRLVIPGVLLIAAAAGMGSAKALPHPVQRVDVFSDMKNRPNEGRGTNILLMGTDGRDTITPEEKREFHAGGVACDCTDTLMLVHVSEARNRVSVVGIPRDSYARIPAHRDQSTGRKRAAHSARINGAYAEGGPTLSVRTVEGMTGVRVDRYLQLDFRRFMDSVETVGGVEVCTPRPLKDKATKLDLPPGRYRLGGGESLQYVRSRHVDTSADFGRIQRQQRFLVGALRSVRMENVLADPGRAAQLSGQLLGAAKVDRGFSTDELLSLASAVSELPSSSLEFTTVPIGGFNHTVKGIGETLRWDRAKAGKVFTALKKDLPLTPRNSTTRLSDPPRFGSPSTVRGDTLECA
ncbi:LCP family protein [Streptomyces sp. NPDC048441]|uniref:LCP family protein n=1 Tax=Streptomyces sp. NPDC048441 TaxID=3365552 RepID=UPI0037182768